MKTYIGAKIVSAEPAEKDGAPGYAMLYPDGYESWCPARTFESTYRVVSGGERALFEPRMPDDVDEALPRGVINEEKAAEMVDG